jgi:hypothetical protein
MEFNDNEKTYAIIWWWHTFQDILDQDYCYAKINPTVRDTR